MLYSLHYDTEVSVEYRVISAAMAELPHSSDPDSVLERYFPGVTRTIGKNLERYDILSFWLCTNKITRIVGLANEGGTAQLLFLPNVIIPETAVLNFGSEFSIEVSDEDAVLLLLQRPDIEEWLA